MPEFCLVMSVFGCTAVPRTTCLTSNGSYNIQTCHIFSITLYPAPQETYIFEYYSSVSVVHGRGQPILSYRILTLSSHKLPWSFGLGVCTVHRTAHLDNEERYENETNMDVFNVQQTNRPESWNSI